MVKLLSKTFLFPLCLIASCGYAEAQDTTGRCLTNASSDAALESLKSVYTVGDIRIFYTTIGTHALIDTKDVDGSGIPDYVENVAKQAVVARQTFNYFGFRDPIDSNRYANVDYIDIQIKKGGGIAFDEAWINTHPTLQHATGCRLIINIPSTIVDFPSNYYTTVAHEMFHLYQSAYTMFKHGWLTEGTANWAERAIRNGATTTSGSVPLPSTRMQLETDVFNAANLYRSEFWNRLVTIFDLSDGSLTLPAHLANATYANGNPVITDGYWKGMALMLSIFQHLNAEDDLLSAEMGWERYEWAESDQKDPAHSMRIIKIIQRVIERTGVQSPEIDAFLSIQ